MTMLMFPVLGVDNMDRAVRFWSQLLDYVPDERDRSDRWCSLRPRNGEGGSLALQLSETPTRHAPRTHLDIGVHGVEDQRATADRVCELGGGRVDWDRWPDNPDFVVVEDSESNRFCLVDLDHH